MMFDPKATPDVRSELEKMTAALKSVVQQGAQHIEKDKKSSTRIIIIFLASASVRASLGLANVDWKWMC